MEDLLNRALLATVGALVAACVGVFVRLRQLEARRAAADVRLDHLEKRGSSAPAVKALEDKVEAVERRSGASSRAKAGCPSIRG